MAMTKQEWSDLFWIELRGSGQLSLFMTARPRLIQPL